MGPCDTWRFKLSKCSYWDTWHISISQTQKTWPFLGHLILKIQDHNLVSQILETMPCGNNPLVNRKKHGHSLPTRSGKTKYIQNDALYTLCIYWPHRMKLYILHLGSIHHLMTSCWCNWFLPLFVVCDLSYATNSKIVVKCRFRLKISRKHQS